MNNILNKYTDISQPGAYSGVSGFAKNSNIPISAAKKELLKSKVYTQHVMPKKKFKRRKFIIPGIDHTWQADLVDVQKIKYQNKHFNYILTVIDCFSKYAWAEPIKFKRAQNTYEAFKKIIDKSNRKPLNLHIDGGNEFKGICGKYLQDNNINVFITESKVKAAIVERFNRTLKEKMWRIFTKNENKKYVDILPRLLDNYNNSFHRTIKNTPSSINKKNESETFKKIYGYDLKEGPKIILKFEFKKGDYVRCVIPKNLFEKGYTINWTDDVYIIDKQQATDPPTYKIKTLRDEIITRTFYAEELKKVLFDEFSVNTYKVIDEKNNKFLVIKLNSEDSSSFWVNKKELLK